MVCVSAIQKNSLILILTVGILCEVCVTNCQNVVGSGKFSNVRALEKRIKDELLSSKYDKDIRPGSGVNATGPTEVTVNLLLRSLSSIDDFKMEYNVQITLRQEWNDPRLKYSRLDADGNVKTITLVDTTGVWMPDLFFINEKEARLHKIIKPNEYIQIKPNGDVLYSIRISLRLACPMFLALFPMDTQTCSIIMASYGFQKQDLSFQWKAENATQVAGLSLPRFSLQEVNNYHFDRLTATGKYSCLQADLFLVRNFTYYLVQMYIPCVMLVIVSWVSFYLDENAIPARTGLGITTLLTMATQAASMKAQSAAVSYTKALDVWSSTCLLFVFLALLEFAVVDYCRRLDKRKIPVDESETGFCCPKIHRKSKKVDVTARIVFPLIFLIFNIVYWSYYLFADDRVARKIDRCQ